MMKKQSGRVIVNSRTITGMALKSFVVILAIPLGVIVSTEVGKIQQKMRAIARIQELGGEITYDFQWSQEGTWLENAKPPGHPCLKRLFGEQYAANPVEIQVFKRNRTSPEKFTDADAKELSRLSKLTWLVLQDTRLTDAGITHLKPLKNLERLDVEGTAVTQKGVAELKKSLPNVTVYYGPLE